MQVQIKLVEKHIKTILYKSESSKIVKIVKIVNVNIIRVLQ